MHERSPPNGLPHAPSASEHHRVILRVLREPSEAAQVALRGRAGSAGVETWKRGNGSGMMAGREGGTKNGSSQTAQLCHTKAPWSGRNIFEERIRHVRADTVLPHDMYKVNSLVRAHVCVQKVSYVYARCSSARRKRCGPL